MKECETFRCIARYVSPLGEMLMASDGKRLTGLWFAGQKHQPEGLNDLPERDDLPVFEKTRAWLAAYFAGKKPTAVPPLAPAGTDYQKTVWRALSEVPYGETVTYGVLAARVEQMIGRKTSARAVGSAVGRNPVSLIVPCHRVLGADGRLVGYAGGVERKKALLEMEKKAR